MASSFHLENPMNRDKSRNHKPRQKVDIEKLGASPAWLFQSPVGLANWLKKELVYRGVIENKQKLMMLKQRNHDLLFATRIKDGSNVPNMRIAEAAYRCPVFGRFKISKRQIQVLKDELSKLGPRRLVVSATGRHFERHEIARFLTRELAAVGYAFSPGTEDEVWMICIDESWYFGIPEMKSRSAEGRDERVSERRGSLPPPIAAAMVFACGPKGDDIVLDPCCGSGTLLSEFHAFASDAQLTGMDIDPEAIAVAKSNLGQTARLISGDSRKADLGDQKVTAVLANLPFGRQFGDKKTNASLYAAILQRALELRSETGWRAVLLTSDVESLRKALAHTKGIRTEDLFMVHVRGEPAIAIRIQ